MQSQESEKQRPEEPNFDALDGAFDLLDKATDTQDTKILPMDELPKPVPKSKAVKGTQSKSTAQAEQNKVSRTPSEVEVLVKEAGTYSGYSDEPQNQYMQVGVLVDMWADLIEGYGNKATEFYKHFVTGFKGRKIPRLEIRIRNLYATGFVNPPCRKMIFVERNPVTMTIYMATQGDDLYVSWRAFAQPKLANWKFGLTVGVSLFIGFLMMFLANGFDRSLLNLQAYITGYEYPSPAPRFGIFFVWTFFSFLLINAWMFLRGYQRFDGDYLAYYREPLYELTADDVATLSAAVHKSVIYAADKIGIDTSKLEVREPFYKERKKRRF